MRKRFILTIGVAAGLMCASFSVPTDSQKDKEPNKAENHEERETVLEEKEVPKVEVESTETEQVIDRNDRRAEAVYEPDEPEEQPVPVPEPEPEKPKAEMIMMEVTGYTAGYESTQKKKGEPGYGITASGTYVEQGRTIAAGKNIPFGTKVYIPYFDNQPGFDDGIFTVEDRGGAIGPYNIDVYYESLTDARNFGRQVLEVYILED